MTTLIEKLAFVDGDEESFEASQIEYEVEVYLKDYDIAQVKSMATSQCSQEQWGIYVPKTDDNASSGSLRVRKTTDQELVVKYEQATKTNAGDQGKNEHELETDEVQFNMFKQLADQGLIKTRFEVPGQLASGFDFKYELDAFYNNRGMLVPWLKIDIELPPGTAFDPSLIPFKYDEMIIITPEQKGVDKATEDKVAELYKTYFTSKNAGVPAIDEPLAPDASDDSQAA